MTMDDFAGRAPAGLEDRYEILDELRRGEHGATWLAHDREAHRDVVITHLRPGHGLGRDTLAQVGADAQLLATQRHAAAVPVLASHWLHDGSLAVVRPRLRGTTLRQLLQAAGALSLERTTQLLREIGDALDWARRSGVSHRGLTAESVCFQQGNGRAFVSFGPTLGDGDAEVDTAAADRAVPVALARCSDTATLGRLAWEMLTTRPAPADGLAGSLNARRGYREPGLAELRPDLPLGVAAEVESALRCERDQSARGPMGFVAALAAAAGLAAGAAPPPPRPAAEPAPVVPPPAARPEAAPAMAASAPAPKRRGGALVAFSLVAALLLAAAVFLLERGGDDERQVAARPGAAAQSEVGGDVEFDPGRVDTGVLTTPGGGRRPTEPLPADPPPPAMDPAAQSPTIFRPSIPSPPISSAPAAPAPAAPSAAASDDPCDATGDAAQQACLRGLIEQNDAALNRVYQQLVGELRNDPAAVAELRARQRDWLARRDAACRGNVRPGTTWARGMAECLRTESGARARDLEDELTRRRTGETSE